MHLRQMTDTHTCHSTVFRTAKLVLYSGVDRTIKYFHNDKEIYPKKKIQSMHDTDLFRGEFIPILDKPVFVMMFEVVLLI